MGMARRRRTHRTHRRKRPSRIMHLICTRRRSTRRRKR